MVKGKNWFIGTLVAVFIIGIWIILYLGLANTYSLMVIASYVVAMVIFYFAIRKIREYLLEQDKKKLAEEESIDFIWRRVIHMLSQRMQSGSGMMWREGKGVKLQKKVIYDAKQQPNNFVAILAPNYATRLWNIIIWHVEKKDIVYFNSSPSVELFNNIFKNFEFFVNQNSGMQGFNPYYGKHKKGHRLGITFPTSPYSEMNQGNYAPTDAQADTAWETVRREGQ